MKPVLTVEGKAHEVWGVYYRDNKVHSVSVFDDNCNTATYHDIRENIEYYTEKPAQIDLETALNWEGRYSDVAEKINKRIEAHEERMIELAFDYIQHDEPFANKIETQKEWHRLNEQVVGLCQALEIVEGKHDENVAERFARGVVEKSLELAKATNRNA